MASGASLAPRRSSAERAVEPESAPVEASTAPSGLAQRGRVTLAVVSGFGVFAFQVLLVRGLALVLDQSVYAFGAVLFVVLLSLDLGIWSCPLWSHR